MIFYRMLFAACLLACAFRPAYADHSSVSFGGEGGGPIHTIPAATAPQGALVAGITSEYVRIDRFSDQSLAALAGRHVHAHSVDWMLTTTLGLTYGVSDNFTLSLRAPYVHREGVRSGSHSHAGGTVTNRAVDHGDSEGPGDIAALGKFRVLYGGPLTAALLLGVKAPTGRTGVSHGGAKLEAEHQPGSRSWDGLFGFAASRQAGAVALDASVLYTLATKGTQDTDTGDRAQYSLAASGRVARRWDLVLELNGEWTNQQEIGDTREDDSGGNQIFVSPGLRYAPDEKWSGHVSVGVPVVSNPGRGHADTDFRVSLGISRAF